MSHLHNCPQIIICGKIQYDILDLCIVALVDRRISQEWILEANPKKEIVTAPGTSTSPQILPKCITIYGGEGIIPCSLLQAGSYS